MLGADEPIDRRASPVALHGGRHGLGDGLIGPVIVGLFLGPKYFLDRGRLTFAGIGRTHGHPGLEIGQRGLVQLGLGRHLETLGGIPFHRLDQQTVFGIARDDDFAAVAALPEGIAGIKSETAFILALGGAVAGVTLRGQHGPDVFLKKLQLLGRQWRLRQ